jgi:hypothetical protein
MPTSPGEGQELLRLYMETVMNGSMRSACGLLAVAVLAFVSMGCETKAQTGTLVGAGAGAGLGAIIGNQAGGNTGTGALIGAGVGAVGGYMVGNEMDKSDARHAQQQPQQGQPAAAPAGAPGGQVTQQNVIDWTNRGVKDEIIIDRVERSGTVFNLNAAEESRLRDAGVSEDVVRAMKNTARR